MNTERTNKTIYLNNAATSWPKPPCVAEAVQKAVRSVPGSQFRSGDGREGSDIFDGCRQVLGSLLGIADTGRICFSSGSTESMNLLLLGLGIPAEQVITTVTEHNSVLRPLWNLPGIAGRPVLLPCDSDGFVPPESLEREAAKGKARAVILNHCSNVTGAVQDAATFGKIAKRYGLLFLMDVSQSAGCMEVRADEWQADAVVFTGHKSLLGLSGTGGFYVRNGVPYRPAKFGGTGRESRKLVYDETVFWQEAGTQNTVGIYALSAACGWILGQGTGIIRQKEQRLVQRTLEQLAEMGKVHVTGFEIPGKGTAAGAPKGIGALPDTGNRGPVVSFTAEGWESPDLGYILSSYGIITRTGLHCSPLIHSYIGSSPGGTVRISFSPFTTEGEVDALCEALREILYSA